MTWKCVNSSDSNRQMRVTSDETLTPTPGSTRPDTRREPQHVHTQACAHTRVPEPGLTPLTVRQAAPLLEALP